VLGDLRLQDSAPGKTLSSLSVVSGAGQGESLLCFDTKSVKFECQNKRENIQLVSLYSKVLWSLLQTYRDVCINTSMSSFSIFIFLLSY
jgi:hypothetical protein